MNELCGELWLETGIPFLNTSDNTTQAAGLASDLNRELGLLIDHSKIKTVYRIDGGYGEYESLEEAQKELIEKELVKKGRETLKLFLDYIEKSPLYKLVLGAYLQDSEFMDAYNNLKDFVERSKT